ncbi:MAG TPA: hypothetical protein VN821_12400 [Candidatus Udaeobacter sp.]|nr:hypothetical protein [Candidatus Udaeobacter sp.]
MSADLDLLNLCRPGDRLRTRDRREARIVFVSLEDGLIGGEVQMHGACLWYRDGRWRDAPFGAPGPLDLVLPAPAAAIGEPRKASIEEALAEGNRLYCCD